MIIGSVLIPTLPPSVGFSTNYHFIPIAMVPGFCVLLISSCGAGLLHVEKKRNERIYSDPTKATQAKLTLKSGTMQEITNKFLDYRPGMFSSVRNDTLGMAVRSGYLAADQAKNLENWSVSYKEAMLANEQAEQQFPQNISLLKSPEFSTESLIIQLNETEEETLKTTHAEYQKNKLRIEGIEKALKELQATLS